MFFPQVLDLGAHDLDAVDPVDDFIDRCDDSELHPGTGDQVLVRRHEHRIAHHLERLGELHSKGVLSDEEFAAEKARLLGGDSGAE